MREVFTGDEIRLMADVEFFRVKARIMKKVRGVLDELHAGLQEELKEVDLLAPVGFDRKKFQFVKGEHLEEYPYQYLDFPKHY